MGNASKREQQSSPHSGNMLLWCRVAQRQLRHLQMRFIVLPATLLKLTFAKCQLATFVCLPLFSTLHRIKFASNCQYFIFILPATP